jgi:pimeloyl-ACP methyl ester carboxylesterase
MRYDSMAHVITYPGFAEGRDAKRLYSEMQAEFPDYTYHILPFYEEVQNGDKIDRVVYSVKRHAEIIEDYMDTLEGRIIVFGKCGGTRPVLTVDNEHMERVEKLVLVNLPWGEIKRDDLEAMFAGWDGYEDTDGTWVIPAKKGNVQYRVTGEYMDRAGGLSSIERSSEIGRSPHTELYIVRGLADEVIPPVRVEKIEGAIPIDIDGGDHHLMKGDSRRRLFGALALHGIL